MSVGALGQEKVRDLQYHYVIANRALATSKSQVYSLIAMQLGYGRS